jgi:membrane protease YdiL (CAAX protease family)
MALVCYCFVLFGLWFGVEDWLRPSFDLGVVEGVPLKIIVWLVPAAVLIWRFPGWLAAPFPAMFTNRFACLPWLGVVVGVAAYVVGAAWLAKGELRLAETVSAGTVFGVLFSAAFIEEVVFRGWLLNAVLGGQRTWLPVIVNAALFTAIHVPLWLRTGVLAAEVFSGSFLVVFALGLILAAAFAKTRNLFVPIAVHACYDLLVFLFVVA